MTAEPEPRKKRRSRALEVLKSQTERPDTDMTDDEMGLISGLIARLGEIPKKLTKNDNDTL